MIRKIIVSMFITSPAFCDIIPVACITGGISCEERSKNAIEDLGCEVLPPDFSCGSGISTGYVNVELCMIKTVNCSIKTDSCNNIKSLFDLNTIYSVWFWNGKNLVPQLCEY